MSEEVLETLIRQYIEAQQVPEISFGWQGGEPTLMGVDFYRKAIEIQEKYRKPGMTFENTLQTNGTLLNDEWAAFFKEHNFLIGISLDGPRELHDVYRLDKGGQPTFDKVLRGLRLLQKHGVEYNVLTTVNRVNADYPLEVYRFLRDEVKTDWMQFIPVVERINADGLTLYQQGATVSDRSVLPDLFGRFLITKKEADIASFKTPDVRNVLVTGPYFHDGSVAHLENHVARAFRQADARVARDDSVAGEREVLRQRSAEDLPLVRLDAAGSPASGGSSPAPGRPFDRQVLRAPASRSPSGPSDTRVPAAAGISLSGCRVTQRGSTAGISLTGLAPRSRDRAVRP